MRIYIGYIEYDSECKQFKLINWNYMGIKEEYRNHRTLKKNI